jgi:hypothetical protein
MEETELKSETDLVIPASPVVIVRIRLGLVWVEVFLAILTMVQIGILYSISR